MAQVNVAIARALSRKRLAQQVQSIAYKKKRQQLELHLTFTANNIFVNFCNGVGETFFVKSFGLIGYTGVHRRTRYALFYFGLEIGGLLTKFLNEARGRLKSKVTPPLSLVLHSALLDKDFRYKRFMDGLRKYKLSFSSVRAISSVAYNGCRLPAHRRTRRFRRFQ